MVRPHLPLLCALLVACSSSDEPPPAGLLDELQVVSVVLEPPSLGRVSSVEVTVTAPDPRERGAEVLVWACTDFGVGCFEQTRLDGKPRPISEWARAATLVEDTVTVNLPVPVFPDALLEETGTLELVGLVWALACAPGVCDIIRAVQEEPEPGSAAWDDVARQLGHPDEWMLGLQPGWASLAVKAVPVGSDNLNPSIHGEGEFEAAPGQTRTVRLDLVDDGSLDRLQIAAWTTLGAVSFAVDGSGVLVSWQAPVETEQESGRIYVVVSDGRGGQAVFTGGLSIVR